MRRYGGDPNRPRRTARATFDAPLKWQQEVERGDRTGHDRLVFTDSWSDFFLEESDAYRHDAWAIIQACPDLVFQILTKRIERAEGRVPWDAAAPWRNVWLGISAEDQATWDHRSRYLWRIPAAIHFVSLEPLLGAIDLGLFDAGTMLDGIAYRQLSAAGSLLDWAIIGGESGNRSGEFVARGCDLGWIRSLVGQLREASIATWVKQLGSAAYDTENGLAGAALSVDPDAAGLISRRLKAPHGDDREEWPADLRVQQMPVLPPLRVATEEVFTLQ